MLGIGGKGFGGITALSNQSPKLVDVFIYRTGILKDRLSNHFFPVAANHISIGNQLSPLRISQILTIGRSDQLAPICESLRDCAHVVGFAAFIKA